MPAAHRKVWLRLFSLTCLLAWLTPGGLIREARADRITLRGGGQVKGKLIPDRAHPGQMLLIGEVGKTPMVLKKDQVVQVTPEKSPLDEYVVLVAKDRPSAEAEYQLGVWCEDHNLKDLAQVHYDLTLKRDSTFEGAHRKLGHVLMGGRWLNSEEVKEAQGMVKYQGRWMTPEEKERREGLASKAAEGSSWVRKIRLLRDGFVAGPLTRSQDSERRLLAIDDPAAVGPVLRVLGEDPVPEIRALCSRVLGGIPGPEAANGMVGRFLQEEDESVRQITMNELARREQSEIVPLLTRALRSAHHLIVNRAGWGLGNLNAVAVVPRLIPALITIEHEIIMVDTVSGSSTTGFNTVAPNSGHKGGAGSLAVVTPPAVGAGSAGYGATSVPGVGVGGSTFSMGSGGSQGPTPRLVPIEYRNDEVHAALVKMTGHDFGYDIDSWKQWVATSFKVDAPPTRRVREP
jgi:hypothetical protein